MNMLNQKGKKNKCSLVPPPVSCPEYITYRCQTVTFPATVSEVQTLPHSNGMCVGTKKQQQNSCTHYLSLAEFLFLMLFCLNMGIRGTLLIYLIISSAMHAVCWLVKLLSEALCAL